jgi:hypothetical protein
MLFGVYAGSLYVIHGVRGKSRLFDHVPLRMDHELLIVFISI